MKVEQTIPHYSVNPFFKISCRYWRVVSRRVDSPALAWVSSSRASIISPAALRSWVLDRFAREGWPTSGRRIESSKKNKVSVQF